MLSIENFFGNLTLITYLKTEFSKSNSSGLVLPKYWGGGGMNSNEIYSFVMKIVLTTNLTFHHVTDFSIKKTTETWCN